MTTFSSGASEDVESGRRGAGRSSHGKGRPSGGALAEWIGQGLFILAALFLAFVAGAMAMLMDVYPAEVLRNSYRAGIAWRDKNEITKNIFITDLWRKARTDARGVTVHVPGKALNGYTLLTSGDGAYARLIAMDGRVAHEWRKPFGEVWHEGAAVKRPQPASMIYMRKARVLPNGDLLAIYTAAGETPWGYGMVKLDRDSNVVWSYLEPTHHDFDVTPDGRILALTHEFTSEYIKGFHELDRPRLDDFLVVLSPDGKELRKISLTHALARSPYERYLHAIPAFSRQDPLHTNTVNYVTKEMARKFPMAREGQVLLSFRDLGLLAVLDPETETITWAVRGPWLGQHDPSILPNGRILLFDNLGAMHQKANNHSRVIEFDPKTMQITWSYAGDDKKPFLSDIRGSAQPLANGNVLVTEDDGGRIFEVTRAGRIVWEYVNPARAGEGNSHIAVLSWGTRLRAKDFDPAFRATIER